MPGSAVEQISWAVLRQLQKAWNGADGTAFGAPFTDDADFVDIRGEYHQGRPGIAAGHQQIFDSIYKGGTVRLRLLRARYVAHNAVLAQAQSQLSLPAGPFAGDHAAVFTMVLVEYDFAWHIAAFHNTPVAVQTEGIPGRG